MRRFRRPLRDRPVFTGARSPILTPAERRLTDSAIFSRAVCRESLALPVPRNTTKRGSHRHRQLGLAVGSVVCNLASDPDSAGKSQVALGKVWRVAVLPIEGNDLCFTKRSHARWSICTPHRDDVRTEGHSMRKSGDDMSPFRECHIRYSCSMNACYSALSSFAKPANEPGLHHLRKNRIA